MAEGVELSGVIEANYFMETPNDESDPSDEPNEGYFGEVCASLKAKAELGDKLIGMFKLAVVEGKSDGVDSTSAIMLKVSVLLL